MRLGALSHFPVTHGPAPSEGALQRTRCFALGLGGAPAGGFRELERFRRPRCTVLLHRPRHGSAALGRRRHVSADHNAAPPRRRAAQLPADGVVGVAQDRRGGPVTPDELILSCGMSIGFADVTMDHPLRAGRRSTRRSRSSRVSRKPHRGMVLVVAPLLLSDHCRWRSTAKGAHATVAGVVKLVVFRGEGRQGRSVEGRAGDSSSKARASTSQAWLGGICPATSRSTAARMRRSIRSRWLCHAIWPSGCLSISSRTRIERSRSARTRSSSPAGTWGLASSRRCCDDGQPDGPVTEMRREQCADLRLSGVSPRTASTLDIAISSPFGCNSLCHRHPGLDSANQRMACAVPCCTIRLAQANFAHPSGFAQNRGWSPQSRVRLNPRPGVIPGVTTGPPGRGAGDDEAR